MGYVRSGLRQHWHVYGVIRDQSVDAFTPTLGFATKVVSVTVLMFFMLIGLVFWISSLHDRPDFKRETRASRQVPCSSASASARSSRDDGVLHLRGPDGAAEGSAARRRPPFGADMTTADMVKIGRGIMEGKGICLDVPHDRQDRRAAASRSRGHRRLGAGQSRPGMSDVEYLAQSLYEPTAFVVPGFPPAMPPVNQPPIGLTDQEILCVIAALQSLGGTPTVTLKTTHK